MALESSSLTSMELPHPLHWKLSLLTTDHQGSPLARFLVRSLETHSDRWVGQTVAMEEICNFWDITHGQTRTDLDPKRKELTQMMHVHEHRRFPKEPEAPRPMLAWRALSMLTTLKH